MVGWVVYGLICEGGKTYIGITNDWERRWKQHLEGKGARFTKSFTPNRGTILVQGLGHSDALREERRIKKLSHSKKLELIRQGELQFSGFVKGF